MKRLLLPVVFVVAVLAGCASGTPRWIASGQHEGFPATRFIVATATGGDAETANAMARSRVSKLLELRLSDDILNASRVQRAGLATVRMVNEPRAAGMIRTGTANVQQGLRIVETWRNPETGTWHAFASMSRGQYAANLRGEIVRLDSTTEDYLVQINQTPELSRKIQLASMALDAQAVRAACERALKAADLNETGARPRHQIPQLAREVDTLLQQAGIAVIAEGDDTGAVAAMVSGAVNASGFRTSAGEQAAYHLEAKFPIEDPGYKDRWYWARGVLSLTLKDARVAREHGSYQWAIKAAGRSSEDAARRVSKQAEVVLGKELRGILVRLATN